MTILRHRHHDDEALLLAPVATVRPSGVPADRLPCKPGTSRNVLDQLMHQAHGHRIPASAVLRTVDLAAVRRDDEPALPPIEENVAAIRAVATPHMLDHPAILDAIAEIRAQLAGVAL